MPNNASAVDPADATATKLNEIQDLIKKLPKGALADAEKTDTIFSVVVWQSHTNIAEEWISKLDAVLGEDTRNTNGRLSMLRGGRQGLTRYCAALLRTLSNHEKTFRPSLGLIDIRLQRLEQELENIM
jgi:hypothetical protein